MNIYDIVLPVVTRKEILENRPEIISYPLLNLRVGFYIPGGEPLGLIEDNLLTRNELRKYYLDFDLLKETAMVNAKRETTIRDFMGTFVFATYKTDYYGAGILACPNILKEMREVNKTNYYLLPSSIHEVIIIPEEGPKFKATELLEIVKAVNGNPDVIKPTDILTDAVYYYGADGLVLLND